MASEDSDEVGPVLSPVHRLGDLRDLHQTLAGPPSQAYGTLRYHLLAQVHSFGRWLEPRYIFAAGQLLDQ